MGFYHPAQLIDDAREHGVEVRPVDINYSHWNAILEEKSGAYQALRLGFREVKGLRQEEVELVTKGRGSGYKSINELREAGLSGTALEKLADADAFCSIGLDRREALWEVSTKDTPQALFAGQVAEEAKGENITLPKMALSEQVVRDYAATSFSLKGHPVSFVREKLQQLQVIKIKELATAKNGGAVRVAGLVLVRQRPGTAKGVCFMTIQDETGVANLVIFSNLFEVYRKEILGARLIMVEGTVQVEGEVIHVIVQACHNFSKLLRKLTPANNENLPLLSLAHSDEKSVPSNPDKRGQSKESGKENVFPKGRNFK